MTLLTSKLAILYMGLLGGLIGLVISYKDVGKTIRVSRTPISLINTLPLDEQVGIVGKAKSEPVVRTPITNRTSVLWQIEASVKQKISRNSSYWAKIYSRTSTEPFDVYDETGKISIYPDQHRLMEIIFRKDANKSSGSSYSLNSQVKAAFEKFGDVNDLDQKHTHGGFYPSENMLFHERFIEQGEQVYILGKTAYKNGIKTVDGDSPLIISNYSKLQLIGNIFWRVLIKIFISAAFGIVLFILVKL